MPLPPQASGTNDGCSQGVCQECGVLQGDPHSSLRSQGRGCLPMGLCTGVGVHGIPRGGSRGQQANYRRGSELWGEEASGGPGGPRGQAPAPSHLPSPVPEPQPPVPHLGPHVYEGVPVPQADGISSALPPSSRRVSACLRLSVCLFLLPPSLSSAEPMCGFHPSCPPGPRSMCVACPPRECLCFSVSRSRPGSVPLPMSLGCR